MRPFSERPLKYKNEIPPPANSPQAWNKKSEKNFGAQRKLAHRGFHVAIVDPIGIGELKHATQQAGRKAFPGERIGAGNTHYLPLLVHSHDKRFT
jgi:hypothetical protein